MQKLHYLLIKRNQNYCVCTRKKKRKTDIILATHGILI